MKPCLSLAASYSAFSDRSPCARASEIAWITAWRSTVFSRCSSSFSFSAPRRVRGMVAMFDEPRCKNENRRREAASAGGWTAVSGRVLVQFRVQFLQRHDAQVVAGASCASTAASQPAMVV